MKKRYVQPDVKIQLFALSDILLFSEDTNISDDDGWLMNGFTVKDVSSMNSTRFGVK